MVCLPEVDDILEPALSLDTGCTGAVDALLRLPWIRGEVFGLSEIPFIYVFYLVIQRRNRDGKK